MTTVEVRHSPCLSSKREMSPLSSRRVTPQYENTSREVTQGSPCIMKVPDGCSNEALSEEG